MRAATAGIQIFRTRCEPPSVDQILKVQGYPNTSGARPTIHAVAETAAGIASRVTTIEGRYRRVGIRQCGEGTLVLEDGIAFRCHAFDRYLAGCEEVVVFILTLGGGIDQVERNMAKNGQMLEAVLLEAAGWMAIEQATKHFTAHLRSVFASEDLKLCRRLAPGYAVGSGAQRWEWPLTDQKSLFDVFGDEPLPVQLLESCAMMPKMSRSGLFGLRPAQGSQA